MTDDLSDVTFMIPVKIESDDRAFNLNVVALYLRHHFNTNIVIAEQCSESIVPKVLSKTLYNTYIHYKTSGFFFHKSRLINVMIKNAKTPIVIMHDSDVLCSPHQYVAAANSLRAGAVDYIYPYNGKVINVGKEHLPRVLDTLKFDFIKRKFTNSKDLALGGCVMYNRDKFIQAGMMNENFISYGPEDGEQDYRLQKFGYRSDRVNEPLFHLDHVRTENSQENHKYSPQNWAEFRKIKKMSPDQLMSYVKTWEWTK